VLATSVKLELLSNKIKRLTFEVARMTKNSKILSHIDAAANIQVFLLEHRYFPTSSSSSVCQNEAIVKDILRLAEYIRSQCQMLQTTDSKIIDDNEVIAGTEVSPHSNDMKNILLAENHVRPHEILSVDVNGGGLSFSSPKLNAGEKSPGFDRLLNKILSSSKPAAPELHEISAAASASPTVPSDNQRGANYTERNYLAKALMSKSSPLSSPSTVTIERVSSYADRLYLCQSDGSSQHASAPGMSDPNVSYVRKFSGENYSDDDDDDDVFDLLKSVDDWPALRTFFRGEIPTSSEILENQLAYSREEHDEFIEDNLCQRYARNYLVVGGDV
jgi:hypothetical protein